MLIQMECKNCDFRPGEATVPEVAAKAALSDYREIGNHHAFTNQGHMIVTRIDGKQKRTNWVAMKTVTCDQCFENIPKDECDIREGLIICRRCSATDLCQCGHMRRHHRYHHNAFVECSWGQETRESICECVGFEHAGINPPVQEAD